MLLKNSLANSQEKGKLDHLLQDVEIEKKLDGLKTYFENFLLGNQRHEDLHHIMDNQKDLEEKLKAMSGNNNPELERQLQDMRDLIKDSQNKKDNTQDFEKALWKINEDSEDKMKMFTKQIDVLKDSFTLEIKNLREEEKKPEKAVVIQKQETVSSLKFTPEKKKPKTPPKAETPSKAKTPSKKVVVPPKKLFNAGDLESDHSIEEPPKPKTPAKKPVPKQKTPPPKEKTPKKIEPKPEEIKPPEVVLQPTEESIKQDAEASINEIKDPEPEPVEEKNDNLDLINKVMRSIYHRDEEFEKTPGKSVTLFKKVKM